MREVDTGPVVAAEPGSFRDPRSRVFTGGGRVFRGLSQEGADDFDAVVATEFFVDAVRSGAVIDTWREDGDVLAGEWAAVLGHRPVPVVSYPYEWSFTMLQDAARLQLRLLRGGLDSGVICKDGSAYNTLFAGSRPIFVDVGSFEPLVPGNPWPGYRQFCQTFLFPLLLQSYLATPFQPLLRAAVDGIPPATADAMLRGRARWRPGVLTHVVLHAGAERRYGSRSGEVVASLRHAGVSGQLVDALAERLEGLVASLRPARHSTSWSEYSPRSHYPPRALAAKDQFVAETLGRQRWTQVLDLGCNDGRFARAAALHADQVVATDLDADVIDTLYRSLRARGPANVLPLVMDIADPSPGLGWGGRERAAFEQRVKPDLVLCLALVHHLAVGRGIPLAEIVEHLCAYRAPVVVEVPHAEDPMVKVLAGGRTGTGHPYEVDLFETLARLRFTVARRLTLEEIPRTLYELHPR